MICLLVHPEAYIQAGLMLLEKIHRLTTAAPRLRPQVKADRLQGGACRSVLCAFRKHAQQTLLLSELTQCLRLVQGCGFKLNNGRDP